MKEIKPIDSVSLNHSPYPATAGRGEFASLLLLRRLSFYLQLTKPTIMLLVLITGATALILEGSLLTRPFQFVVFLVGLYMTGGAANAFNQYFERDIDARMTRTMKRRPLPLGQIGPGEALAFSIALGAAGVALLWVTFNLLTAALSLATILFYSLFYTLWLKPNTPQNIVIGGIAGAMAPIGAWTAATGATAWPPWILFLIVFLWTPPHFWALALCFQDDYERARLPMLPVIKGIDATFRQIYVYTMVLIAASFAYLFAGGGLLYGLAAALLSVMLVRKTVLADKRRDRKSLWGLFTYSIIYLFALFLAMIIDKFAGGFIAR